MKSIARILVPAALAVGIVGSAGAKEILVETEYPGPTPTVDQRTNVASTQTEPFLIQSNSEGPTVNPVYERRMSSRDRAEVQADATIALPYGPGMNA